jgi:hypothetical protein
LHHAGKGKVCTLQPIIYVLKRTFHIAPERNAKADVLLCELSPYHMAVAQGHGDLKKLESVSYYELRNLPEPEKVQDILRAEGATEPSARRVVLGNTSKNVLLVPASQFAEESAQILFDNLYGRNHETLFFDDVPQYNLVVVHTVPQGLMGVLKSGEQPEVVHVFSSDLKKLDGNLKSESLSVHFSNKEFRVLAVKEEQLKLAQTYMYTSPMDVVYYLLSICQEYGFSQAGTRVLLSGLVNEESAMYKELHQYFSALHFWKLERPTLQSEHPPHYFSSLYNLAACVL